MKTIYFIREPRSGGTFLESYIRTLKRDEYQYETTHNMTYIKSVPKNSNSIVIRTTRKNFTEHFLSAMAIQTIGSAAQKFTNFTYEKPYDPIFDKIKNSRIQIKKNQVIDWVEGQRDVELLFNDHTKNLNYQIVYYEDMFKPFDIPILDLYNIDFSLSRQYTYKLPDYKREVFTNYDQVQQWMEKIKNAYAKKYNFEKFLEHWASYTSS